MCVCVQGCAGEPGGEDEYVERGSSFRIIYGRQEVSVSVCSSYNYFSSVRERERLVSNTSYVQYVSVWSISFQ